MSKTVDERVVEMRFDNKQFESNAKQSMNTLERLKSSLKFDKSANGLEKIGRAAKNVNMQGLAASVDEVKRRFSALDVIGVTALANITNSAVNAGKKMVKALTLEPVMTGFQEYETKINAVQTILANTSKEGMTMQDVTTVLDDLNTYADKTIYNFTEMTRNIGTFTAAGVKLYDAAGAIKGIANLAAVSGSSSQQASTAMYQLSQALATGRVALQDWNSVVNAGMGGTKFQEALKQTAREMGIAVDDAIEKYGSFRDSLTKGEWLTADVLNETLKKFTVEGAAEYSKAMMEMGKYTQAQADALMREAQIAEDAATKVKTFTQLWDVMKEATQSGWAQTWEIIIGDFEEAKQFLTPIADTMSSVIAESAQARNSILESGLQSSWKTISNDIRDAGIDVNDFQEKLIEVGKTHGVITDDMIVEAGSFEESLRSGWASGDIFAEALRSYKKTADDFGITTESMQDRLTKFQETVKDVWDGEFVTQQERMRALAQAGYDYNEVQDLISKTLKGQGLTLDELSIAQMKALGFTQDEIMALQDMAGQAETTGTAFNQLIQDLTKPSGRELLLEAFTNSLMNVIHIMDVAKEAWAEAFPAVDGSTLYGWLEGLRDLTARFSLTAEQAENLKWTFRGLFSILHMLYKVVTVPLSVAFEALSHILPTLNTPILTITGSIGRLITWFDKLIFASGAYERMVRALPEAIGAVVVVLGRWFNEFKELPQVQEAVAKVQETFNKFLDFIKERIGDTGDALGDFIDRIKKMDQIHLTDLPNIFKDFYHNVVNTAVDFDGIFTKIAESLKRFFEMIKSLASNIGTVFSTLGNVLSKVGSKIRDTIKNDLDFGDVIGVLVSGGTLMALMKFGKIIDMVAGPLEGFTNILNKFAGVLGSVEKWINAKAWEVKAKSIKTIATALLELAAALWIISQIPAKELGISMGAIVALGAGLIGFSAAMNKVGGPAGLEKCAGALIAFGASIALISHALKTIADIETGKLIGSMLALEVIMASLAGVAIAMAKWAPELSTGSIFLLSFSASIRILVSSLDTLNKIKGKDLPKTIALLIGSLVALSTLAKIAAGIDLGTGVGLVAMVAAVKLLTIIMKDLASIKPETALKAMIGMIPVLVMMKSMLLLISGTDFSGALIKAGASLALMSVAILMLTTSMKVVAGIKAGDAIKGIVAINSFLLSFAIVLLSLRKIEGQMIKAAASLTIMSVAIGILAGIMLVLGKLDPAGMARALAAILLLEGCFAALIYVSKFATVEKGTITALAVSVAALAATMVALSMVDPAGLARGTVAITAIMGMFTLLIKATAVAKKANAAVFIMLGVVAALAGMLIALAQLPVDASIKSAAAISVLLVTMTASLYALSYMKAGAMKAVGVLSVLALVVAELAAILGIMAEFNVEGSIETATSISILLATMTGVFAVMAGLGHLAVPAIAGVGAFDVVILAIGGLMAGIGALVTYFPKLKEFVNNGIDLLNDIASGIGEFIGNLVGGVAEGFTSHMGAMADNLSDFMERLQPFIRGAKKINPSVIEGVSSLSTMILKLTGADFLNSITSFITGGSSLTQFAEELIPFGEALAEFAKKTKRIDAEQMFNVSKAAENLANMADALPEKGGLKEKIMGVKDMEDFIANLNPLADALIAFNQKITAEGAIDVKKLTAVTEAAQRLVDLANAIPSKGGLKEKIMGVKDLSAFADSIVTLGDSLSTYSSTVGDINTEKINQVTEAAQSLADLNQSLPSIGGVAQFFAGNKDIGVFGEKLQAFGTSLAAYSTAVTGKVDLGGVEASRAAGQMMSDLANTLPEPGFFSLQYDFKQFGIQLEAFGSSLAAYSNSIAGIGNFDIVANSAAAGEAMVALMKNLPEGKLNPNKLNLSGFGDQLSSFGVSLAAFAFATANVNFDQINSVIDATQSLADLGANMASVDLSGFAGFAEDLQAIVKLDLDMVGQKINDFCDSVKDINVDDLNPVVSIVDSLAELGTAMKDVDLSGFTQFATDMESIVDINFETLGEQLSKFYDSITGLNAEDMQPFADVVNLIGDIALSMAGMDLTGFRTFIRATANFDQVGTALTNFQASLEGVNAEELSTSISAVDQIATLAQKMSGLDLESFTTAVTSFRSLAKYSMGGLGENLKIFGESFAQYATSMESINPDTITSTSTAAESLAKLAENMPDPGLLSTKLTLPELGTQLPAFGLCMSMYSKLIQGFDEAAVTGSARAGTALADLATNLPDPGFFSSQMTLGEFAAQLIPFGVAFGAYGRAIKDVDPTVVTSTAVAAQSLAALAERMPDPGFFSSQVSLGEFAGQLIPFGLAFGAYARAIADVDPATVTATSTAAQSLATLAEAMPDPGFFSTQQSLVEFSAQLPEFGANLAAYSTAVSGVSQETITRTAGIATSLTVLANSLPEGNLFGIQNGLTYFGADLVRFGEYLSDFSTKIANVKLDSLSTIATQLEAFIPVANSLTSADVGGALKSFSSGLASVAEVSIQNIVSKLNGGAEQVRAAVTNLMSAFNSQLATNSLIPTKTITDMVSKMVSAVNQASPQFSTAASSIMNGFSTAVTTGLRGIDQKFVTMLNSCVTTINNKYSAFSQAGAHVIGGLIAGMSSREHELMSRARSIANRLADTINKGLEVNSPSKKTTKTGMYVIAGLVKGMTDNIPKIDKAGQKAGQAVIDSLQKELIINSPSIKARDEVGVYVIEGIAEGIEKDMSAEEAASKKAENIIAAFQNEFAKIQNVWNLADLKWQLEDALDADVIGEAEQNLRKYRHQQDQIVILAEETENLRGKWQTMIKEFGAESDEAREAETEYIQKQIELAKLAKENQDLVKTINENRTEYNNVGADAFKRYQEEMEKLKPAMDQFGYSLEQIDEIARRNSGYGNFTKFEMLESAGTIRETVQQALAGVKGTYEEFAKTGFGTAISEFAKTGKMIGNAMTEGFSGVTKQVEETSEVIVNTTTNTILDKTDEAKEAGKSIGEAYAEGLAAAAPAVKKASDTLTNISYAAVSYRDENKKTDSQKSPGGYSGKTVSTSSQTTSGFNKELGEKVRNSFEGTWVRLDSDTTKNLATDISTAISTSNKLASNIASNISSENRYKNVRASDEKKVVNNTYNMTQNNTSPKALSASTIYRQTSNLFSSLKNSTVRG